MGDVLGDFARRTLFAIQQHVRLAIERFAHRQQLFDFFKTISPLQQRPMRLMADVLENGFRRCPEAYDQRMFFQAFHVRGIHNEPAAGRNHATAHLFEFANDLAFVFAKTSFAVVDEDFGDAFSCALFDQHIRIDKAQV